MTNRMIARIARRVLDQPLAVRLYVGGEADEESIVEAGGGGYGPKYLGINDWIIAPGATAEATSEVVFTFDGTKRLRIVGAYITQSDGGIILVKHFLEPLPVGRNGDTIPVKSTFRLGVVTA